MYALILSLKRKGDYWDLLRDQHKKRMWFKKIKRLFCNGNER